MFELFIVMIVGSLFVVFLGNDSVLVNVILLFLMLISVFV